MVKSVNARAVGRPLKDRPREEERWTPLSVQLNVGGGAVGTAINAIAYEINDSGVGEEERGVRGGRWSRE
eukprot:7493853-Alexandrium_andersonii.AAC.1